jgi:transposase
MRTPGSAQVLERVRLIACNMFERDVSSKQIAQDLGMHAQTVREWRRVYKQRGAQGLRLKPHPGRPALLSDEQRQQLLTLLKETPTSHGFERHFWTTAMIAELIKRKFDIDYNADWVGEMLHALGMSWQKPMRRARERDEQKIQAWREQVWPEVLKKTPQKTA